MGGPRDELRSAFEREARERWLETDDGTRLRVLDFDGAGREAEPLVVVPGFASVFQGWEEVVRDFAAGRRVLYFESREKGSSRMPDRATERAVSLSRMARDLAAVESGLELVPGGYAVLGSSTGCTILVEALEAGWLAPRVAVLVGPAIEHRLTPWAALGTSLLPTVLRPLALPLYRLYLRSVGVDRERHPEQFAKYFRAAQEASLPKIRRLLWEMTRQAGWERLPRVATPCLVVGAEDDGMHAAEDARRCVRLLPDARLIELADNRETHSTGLVEEVRSFLGEGSEEAALARVAQQPEPELAPPVPAS